MYHPSIPTVDVGAVPADAFLLDVREPDEWAAGHARGAVHVPIGEVTARVGELTEQAGDARVFVVCRVGGRSAQVTGFLAAQGVDAVNVDGGMLAWAAAGRPLVAGDSGAGEPYVL
ncbi:rhodanese-like domain-containing protein [Streptomyces sp. TRM 70351]|uniref:rhodanese-like domain-containing protein n=1 Tax=Streptomyces sp. TRM 70351 TaxID=3116552 RepID=UPI002E7AE287|nr:rhodanese-like domain-containing protein [Streptomyces sp. TRM 70351]MEE1930057.1 rhodanese-like domain-containing protein [Streptomyces sp. TRM 70351]